MNKYILLLAFISISSTLFSQIDSGKSSITINFDTTWNHSITRADLILKLSVDTRVFLSGTANFYCTITKVVKGEYNSSSISWTMSVKDASLERTHKRFDAINPPLNSKKYSAYVGFYKTQNETSDIKDPITGEKYNFFMSSTSSK